MTSVTFLGTGEYLASERYWNSFVVDRRILVEPSPTALPHLRRCGLAPDDLDVVLLSHFHPDHTFGWPFLMLELLRCRRADPVHVVGPPGVERYLADMMALGGVTNVWEAVHEAVDLRYLEVDGTWQTAGPLRFRAVAVDHVAHLDCFGFILDRGATTLGYSGDTTPCPGLDEMAAGCDTLILECNGPHPPPVVHMDVPDVRQLRDRFPGTRLVLTHLGPGIDASGIADCVVPDDFDTLEL